MSQELTKLDKNIFGPADLFNPGIYSGSLNKVSVLSNKLSDLKERHRLKRWHFMSLASDEFYLVSAVVDLGYASNAFITLVDLKTGSTLFDSSFMGLPKINATVNESPGAGALAYFKSFGVEIKLSRDPGRSFYKLKMETKDLHLEANFDSEAAPIPVAIVGKNRTFTQKTNLMTAKGTLTFKGLSWKLDRALAGLDYSAGLYPRETQWYWGFAQGRLDSGESVGFNLAHGNNLGGQLENALWLNQKAYSLGVTKFDFNRESLLGAWKMTSEDGILDLEFMPRGFHRERKDLILVQSRFSQILGLFSGKIKDPISGKVHQIHDLPGIAEDQFVRW